MKRDSEESIRRQISLSTAKHQKLEGELGAEQQKSRPNHLKISDLKKLKLRCKDQIAALNRALLRKRASTQPSADIIQLPIPHPAVAVDMTSRLAASG